MQHDCARLRSNKLYIIIIFEPISTCNEMGIQPSFEANYFVFDNNTAAMSLNVRSI